MTTPEEYREELREQETRMAVAAITIEMPRTAVIRRIAGAWVCTRGVTTLSRAG